MARLDHAMQVIVDAERLHAAVEREGVGAFESFNAAELGCDVSSVALDDRGVGIVHAFVDCGRDAGHRRQVVAAVLAFDRRRQRAAHRKPHDDFGAFEAAELGVFGDRHLGQLFRIAFEKIEKAPVPFGIVEAGALAMHLVRQTTGGDDCHAQIFGIAFDGASKCLAELVEAASGGNRKLQHAHLQRNETHRPFGLVRAQHRKR